jgi:hypothetical protein
MKRLNIKCGYNRSTGKMSEQFHVLLDDEDYEIVKNYHWRLNPSENYAFTDVRLPNRRVPKQIALHRLIAGVADLTTDSIYQGRVIALNKNKLDCRKKNLQVVYSETKPTKPTKQVVKKVKEKSKKIESKQIVKKPKVIKTDLPKLDVKIPQFNAAQLSQIKHFIETL